MKKRLEDMTLQELWELFPIYLTKYNPEWEKWYQDEERYLKSLLGTTCKITHIGSTAVKTIWAKPIIDILIETKNIRQLQDAKSILVKHGYICMSESETRASLNKGYTVNGFAQKVFHIHLRLWGDNDEIYFKNYLIAHPKIAQQYEALKLSLWEKYEHDRDRYTAEKTDFITKYPQKAKNSHTNDDDIN